MDSINLDFTLLSKLMNKITPALSIRIDKPKFDKDVYRVIDITLNQVIASFSNKADLDYFMSTRSYINLLLEENKRLINDIKELKSVLTKIKNRGKSKIEDLNVG